MTSLALDIFNRLMEQVDEIEQIAVQAESTSLAAPTLRRSAFVLAVAALDTYFHEQAARRLTASATVGATDAARVAQFVGRTTPADVSGPAGESHIRMQLSYRTFVAPARIDAAIGAWGEDSIAVWRDVAFARGTRPDRLRLQLELIYDRRNQIAHEGDWDLVQLDFRPMRHANLADCVTYLTELVEIFDQII